jgi:hypothetical protein
MVGILLFVLFFVDFTKLREICISTNAFYNIMVHMQQMYAITDITVTLKYR